MSAQSSGFLKELLALPLQQRIESIANDVSTHADKFREIEPHDLAAALGVPQARKPDGRWRFARGVEKLKLEEYAELDGVSEVLQHLYLIEDKLPAERFKSLNKYLEADYLLTNFSMLTAKERTLLEEAIAHRNLEDAAANGMCCFARYSILSSSGYELPFEADVEDDGACIHLRTPYDFRDGRFINLENCVTDHW
jgi:hypothetical protein